MPKPFQVMWWVPAGHRPSVAEARARLEFLARHGESDMAFGMGRPALPPPAPEVVNPAAAGLSLDGRRFVLESNDAGGDCAPGTTFEYRQEGWRVWALYGGGAVAFGALVAGLIGEGALDARYQHATVEGQVRAGRCETRVEQLGDGRLRLHERWQWLSGAEGEGRSTLVES
jgi:hypothetical protein